MCRDRGGCRYKPKDLPKARVTHSRHLLGGARDRKGANVIGGRDQSRPGVGPSGREGPPVSESGGVGKSARLLGASNAVVLQVPGFRCTAPSSTLRPAPTPPSTPPPSPLNTTSTTPVTAQTLGSLSPLTTPHISISIFVIGPSASKGNQY